MVRERLVQQAEEEREVRAVAEPQLGLHQLIPQPVQREEERLEQSLSEAVHSLDELSHLQETILEQYGMDEATYQNHLVESAEEMISELST